MMEVFVRLCLIESFLLLLIVFLKVLIFLVKNGHQIFRLLQVEKSKFFHIKFRFFYLVLLQIIELLADPSTESPVVPAIAQQILKNPKEFYETARKYTETHAQPKDSY